MTAVPARDYVDAHTEEEIIPANLREETAGDVRNENDGRTAHGCDTEEFGEAIGKIAALAAISLHDSFPHLDLEGLVETFTQQGALGMLAVRYLSGIERGLTPSEAAAEAGVALIHAWADARHAARAELDKPTDGDPVRDDCPISN
ncbi:hypothetical protein [Streptomyces sp. NPDC001750]|uniref:hypothetical protein n=1 Tax=Streptomyces sp. NPDC001750 TaxID=3364607 RepID=UPI00367AE596